MCSFVTPPNSQRLVIEQRNVWLPDFPRRNTEDFCPSVCPSQGPRPPNVSIKLCVCVLPTSCPVWGRGTPLPPLSIYFLIFSPFYFSLSFIGFTCFLLLSIPSLSTRIVPLRFQAGGRRRRPNLVLVYILFCNLCYLYSLVKMDCGVLFYLIFVCVPSVL